ncbi:sulfotransferase family 2 domain-containing protein [Nocardioides campestrisoli]|uniref:sulfotransferase family 2 domain-containing protein n=1 Tax=Nocardioides campestrisoli TaxID=2736757 RepID=UPI0015E6BB72|nr:sulfotransferase family 2 domain-containing protein [Nocardioides campestrisoli]
MIVSHQHRFVFLKTRKTAGTSVEIALSKICGPDDIISRISPEDEELRAAAGGRGPQNHESPPLVRRAFNHMPAQKVRKVLGRATWDDYYRFAIERNPWDTVVSLYYWKFRERPGARVAPPFSEFVDEESVEQLAENQRIYRIDGKVAVDRILRYERLGEELAEVWEHLGLPGSPELPRAKGSARPRRDYRELYDDVSRDKVAKLFSDSIEELGYEF